MKQINCKLILLFTYISIIDSALANSDAEVAAIGISIGIPVYLCGGVLSALSLTWIMLIFRSKNQKISSALTELSKRDKQWDEGTLLIAAKSRFELIHMASSSQNLNVLKKALHPELFVEWKAKVDAQVATKSRTHLSCLTIEDVLIVDMENYLDDEKDIFTVCIRANAVKQELVNEKSLELMRTTL